MTCDINMTDEFQNALFKTHFLSKDSPHLGLDRSNLFYFTCIPVRLTIVAILLFLSNKMNNKLQNILAMLIYLVTLFRLLSKSSTCQWWSNELEIILLTCGIFVNIFAIYYDLSGFLFLSIFMGLSIFSGLLQSFILKPFSK